MNERHGGFEPAELRDLDLDARRELLMKSTGLDEESLRVLRPEHGLAVRPDHAERVLAELRSMAPPVDTPEPELRTDDFGYPS